MTEYQACAEAAASVDYGDKKSVRRFNAMVDRMREIVDEVVSHGEDAVLRFTTLLDTEPAAFWVAHHLVEKASLDKATLARCFARVERAKLEAEEKGDMANAMGEEMWLREWKTRTT